MTNRDFVSRVKGRLKLYSGDRTINDRTILFEGIGVAISLIKREISLRRLASSDSIYTTIPCLELEEVPLGSCCSYQSSRTITRSKMKLPRISEGIFNYAIKGVYGIGYFKELKYAPIKRYINLLKLGLQNNDIYYWIHDGRLYTSSPDLKAVSLEPFFEEPILDLSIYSECDCDESLKVSCPKPMDEDFKCPNYLIHGTSGNNGVISIVTDTIIRNYFNVPLDKTSNNLDEQSK